MTKSIYEKTLVAGAFRIALDEIEPIIVSGRPLDAESRFMCQVTLSRALANEIDPGECARAERLLKGLNVPAA